MRSSASVCRCNRLNRAASAFVGGRSSTSSNSRFAGSCGDSFNAFPANRCAASINAGSFNEVSACSGVFVRMRRIVQVSPFGASKFIMEGYALVRRMNVYNARR